jgi:hypothetical protein
MKINKIINLAIIKIEEVQLLVKTLEATKVEKMINKIIVS